MNDTSGARSVAHSVLTDPAFAKMNELKHAQGCEKNLCAYPNCAETRFLLKHIGDCGKKEQCKYKDCTFARVLLDHSRGLHLSLAGCPLCKKQEILKRLHPGKAPRTSTSDEDDEDEKEKEKKKAKMDESVENEGGPGKKRKLARPNCVARRSLRSAPSTKQHAKRAYMMQLLHSNKCPKKSCAERHCAYTKQLLYHIKECPHYEQCFYPGCVVGRELMNHFRRCKPVIKQCPICDKQAPPLYTGEDALSRMPALVLRTIFRAMGMESPLRHLRPVTQVNRRFRYFLKEEKELRGLCEKERFEKLTMEQVGDSAVCFHFTAKLDGGGYFYVLSTVGSSEEELIQYDEKHSVAAQAHIATKYPRCSDSSAPIRIPLEFYDVLAQAFLAYDFNSVELRNIIIDADFFNCFIDRMNDIFPMERVLSIKNVRIEPSERCTKECSGDFEAVLDIRSVVHLCKTEHKPVGDEKTFPCGCGMIKFVASIVEDFQPESEKSKVL